MKLKLILIATLLIPMLLSSQEQRTRLRNVELKNIRYTKPDGSVWHSDDAGKTWSRLQKVSVENSSPSIEWIYSSEDTFGVYKILELSDNSYVIASGTDIFTPKVARISKDGNLLWKHVENKSKLPIVYSNLFVKDDKVVFFGVRDNTEISLAVEGYPKFITLDTTGNKISDVEAGRKEDYLVGKPVTVNTSDRGYLFAFTKHAGADSVIGSMIVQKADEAGKKEWNTLLLRDTVEQLYPRTIFEESDGYVISGSATIGSWGFYNPFMLKVDKEGKLLWKKFFTNAKSESNYAAIRIQDGYLLANGQFINSGTGWNVSIVKTDFEGNLIERRLYDVSASVVPTAICPIKDGGLAITGYNFSPKQDTLQFYLLMLDKSLNKKQDFIWRLGQSNRCSLSALVEDIDGNLIVGGQSNFHAYIAKISLQPTSAVDNSGDSQNTISLFPNPAETTLNVMINSGQASEIVISAYDILGNKISTLYSGWLDAGKQSVRLSTENLQNGRYYLRISRGNTTEALPFSVIR